MSNVVAAVWGTEFIQFLAARAVLHWDDFDNKDELILFFKIILVQFIPFFKSSILADPHQIDRNREFPSYRHLNVLCVCDKYVGVVFAPS